MQTTNIRETREQLSSLLDAVAAGEEVIILRHGKPAAKLTAALPERVHFPDRQALRAAIPASSESAAQMIRSLRDNERY